MYCPYTGRECVFARICDIGDIPINCEYVKELKKLEKLF